MKSSKILISILIVTTSMICCKSTSTCNKNVAKIYSVADLLNNPVYEKNITVYGVIGELGKRNCKCFKLSSKGKSISAWYDMMVDDNRKRQSSVSMKDFKNNTKVILTGTLKNKGKHVQKNNFWIKSIRKYDK